MAEKSKAAVDLDDMEVYTLDTVARKIGLGYYNQSKLQALIDDPEKSTPTPKLVLNGSPVWDKTGILDWKALWDKETQRERELEEERLNSETLKKASIVEHLLSEAETLRARNANSYKHNRGNSLRDGRMRVLEFQGKYDFVRKLMGDLKIPDEKLKEINENLRKAKHQVNME